MRTSTYTVLPHCRSPATCRPRGGLYDVKEFAKKSVLNGTSVFTHSCTVTELALCTHLPINPWFNCVLLLWRIKTDSFCLCCIGVIIKDNLSIQSVLQCHLVHSFAIKEVCSITKVKLFTVIVNKCVVWPIKMLFFFLLLFLFLKYISFKPCWRLYEPPFSKSCVIQRSHSKWLYPNGALQKAFWGYICHVPDHTGAFDRWQVFLGICCSESGEVSPVLWLLKHNSRHVLCRICKIHTTFEGNWSHKFAVNLWVLEGWAETSTAGFDWEVSAASHAGEYYAVKGQEVRCVTHARWWMALLENWNTFFFAHLNYSGWLLKDGGEGGCLWFHSVVWERWLVNSNMFLSVLLQEGSFYKAGSLKVFVRTL